MKNGNTDEIKDILKIRFHMWDVRKNYPKKWHRYNMLNLQKEKDTTEHVLDWEEELDKEKRTIGSSNINHWKQTLKIFWEKKNKRKTQM